MFGRRREAGQWPTRRPVGTLSALLVAAAAVYVTADYRISSRWSETQRLGLKPYVLATVATAVGLGPRVYDLRPVGGPPGARYVNADVAAWLRARVYHGVTLEGLARPPLLAGLVVLLVGLPLGIRRDLAAARRRRQGTRNRGPELVNAAIFNARVRGDGLRFEQEGGYPPVVLPRAAETSHVLILGDTGTGKSSLIRQALTQLARRGDESAIIYDPGGEYVRQFYRPDRGDQILNPMDARCPSWSPADELTDGVTAPAEALTLATALFPPQANEAPFFKDTPRQIFAHLLTLRPSAAQLTAWLSSEADLDRLLAGTPYATYIDPKAPAQRSGVISALNMPARTLAMLPEEHEGRGTWSARAWARQRRGWLFFTSAPETREQLIPLMTLWLDMLILRLMHGHAVERRTWIVIDELASIRRLPQLATGMTEARKANVAIVVGFQAKSQLDLIYGHGGADAMLSQPETKIVLRTSEANSAKWLSSLVGDVEMEWVRESRSRGDRGESRSFSLDRRVEPLVMPSEMEGLPSRCGYLKHGNLVTPLTFPYVTLPDCAVPYLERYWAPPDPEARPAPAAAVGASAPEPPPRRAPRARNDEPVTTDQRPLIY